jgi:predicted RNA binding protein YcfA (HicA-like mRNA interferase family)
MTSRSCGEAIQDLHANARTRTFDDLRRVLEDAGFVMRSRTSGSHRTFAKPACSLIVTLVETRGPLFAAYVRMVMRALEECCDDD